jgi:predicted nuclease of predicted toxin-antitoxin system
VRFLADESCDFAMVRALRDVGHDVMAIAEVSPAVTDDAVLALARSEARILLTEDKDFGLLAYARRQHTAGVVLVRFPADARSQLGETLASLVEEIGERLNGAFVVVEPGRARISKPPGAS